MNGVKTNDIPVVKVARTIILSRMVHGEMIDNHRIDPWTLPYEASFVRLAMTSWTQARNDVDKEFRQHVTEVPYDALISFVSLKPNSIL